jgi:WD40 repeat protein
MFKRRDIRMRATMPLLLLVVLYSPYSCNGVAPPPWPTPGPGVVKTLTGHWLWVMSVAWSPDGKKIASGSSDHTVIVWDVDSGNQIANLDFPGTFEIQSVQWSPDGKSLATGQETAVQVWDTTNWRSMQKITPRGSVGEVAWSPDGKSLAVGLYFIGADNNPKQNGVDIYDTSSGQVSVSLVYSEAVNYVTWSPDGAYLAFAPTTGPTGVVVWNLSKGGGQATSNNTIRFAEPNQVGDVVWSPDGKYMAYGTDGHMIRIYDVSNWQQISIITDPSIGSGRAAWSPDGEKIASVSADQTIRVWDLATKQNTDTFKHPDFINDIAWSPDSKLVASATSDHKVYVWQVKPGSNTPSPGTP